MSEMPSTIDPTDPLSTPAIENLPVEQIAAKLTSWIVPLQSAVVAFSGGVDSAVVAAAAFRALGNRAVAITGLGEAVSQEDRGSARSVAQQIGIRHLEVPTDEIENPDYVRNDGLRCYHCKSTLYKVLHRWAAENGYQTIVSGTNRDDLGDYRPGLVAAKEVGVVAPLAELQIGKNSVRKLAAYFSLSVADKPASPCLASRIAYGQSVTPERLRQIEEGEKILREMGFFDVRVRLHADQIARLELHVNDWHRLLDNSVRVKLCEELQKLGFRYVTMDLMSRQTGSLNRSLPVIH